MATFGQNPMVIEAATASTSRQAPLVLIHDSSGLIFHYLQLQNFNRAVYGVYDPHFFDEKDWEGGLGEICRYYWELIRQQIPKGDIILGGWSLGGLIAMEMASVTPHELEISVLGIIMVDTINPKYNPEHIATVRHAYEYAEHTSTATRRRIKSATNRSEKLVEDWSLPEWETSATSHEHIPGRPACPRTILLKALQRVTVKEPGSICVVDIARDCRLLGWEDCGHDLIEKVFHIPGDHYSVFAPENLTVVADKLKAAVDLLEVEKQSLVSRVLERK